MSFGLPRIPPFGWLLGASACWGIGFGLFVTIFTNFVAEDLQIRPDQLGLLESIREIPGLLTIALAAVVMTVAEPLVGAAALVLLGIGYLNYFHVQSVETLIVVSLVASVGFHMWMPVSNTLALRLSKPAQAGRRLGQLRAVTAVAQMLGVGVVAVLAGATGLRPLFVVSGVVVMAGSLMVLRVRGVGRVGRPPRFLFRRRYRLYYALTLLDGARRHVFMTFAIFLLVRNHGTPVQTIALLALVNSGVTIGAAYLFGRSIDRFGERLVLMVGFAALAVIFTGYAFIPVVGILFGLYVLDNFFFSAEAGVTTYLHKILLDPSDLRPSLVTGQTMNHVAAVIAPVTGGLLWSVFGHEVTFVGGAILAALSFILSTRIKIGRADHLPAQPVAAASADVAAGRP